MTPLPDVTDAEAAGDFSWFDAHPDRRFRARRAPNGLWLVRKRKDVFLRAFSKNTAGIADSDAELGPAWWAAAWPELLSIKAERKARQAGVRRAGGRR